MFRSAKEWRIFIRIAGGFLPVLPGPPLSWVAPLLVHFSESAKDEISMTALVVWLVIAILVLLVLWGISVQRRLVAADELTGNSMSQIGVQQNSRWDALTALSELVKGYDEHEYKTLMDVIAQRTAVGRGSSAGEANAQEGKIADALRQINVIAEQYPDLKANTMYAETMKSVNQYENQVRLSRMTYNDCVTKFNRIVRQFPGSVIASLLHFSVKDYLAEPQGKTGMPSMK